MHNCRKCNDPLVPPDNIAESSIRNKCYICRSCDNTRRKLAHAISPEIARSRGNTWKQNNPEKVKANGKRYREQNIETIKAKATTYAKTEGAKQRRKEWLAALKIEVFSKYGSGRCVCAHCGFTDIRALSIDHIYGSGTEHRKQLNGGGARMYQWLRSENYPAGYQVLCMNCQFIKRFENNEVRNGILTNA